MKRVNSEETFNPIQELLSKIPRKNGSGKGSKIFFLIILIIILIIWGATGVYIVAPDEVGVVIRFGKFVRQVSPGPHWHIPFPIESVLTPKVTKIRKIEVGFETIQVGPPAKYKSNEKESLMLTGDENIVDISFIVQYKVKEPVKFLFNVKDVEQSVKDVAEAAMREIVGKKGIDEILTTGRAQIQEEVEILMSKVLDNYDAGIKIERVQLQDVHPPNQVIQAFKDVASAKEDREKLINEAYGYKNDILPKAKGEAAKIIKEAEGYAQERIKKAEGEANRFKQILSEYEKEKEITKQRIYIEAMETILKGSDKIIIQDKGINNLLPLLQLNGNKKEVTKDEK